MILRLFLTALILALWGGAINVLSPVASLILGKQAVSQLNPSDTDYLQTMAVFGAYRGLDWAITIIGLLLLLAIWVGPIRRAIKEAGNAHNIGTALAALALGGMALAPQPARAYYDKADYAEWRNILPNQSAFLIPAVGDNKASQGQFGSAEYLDSKKVAAKRVQIPHVKLENSGLWSNFYVPAATLIIVDRTPFYREWTNASDKGTSKDKQGFTCESKDSLNVTTAIAISATVAEADAHKFLYWFGVKAVKGDPADVATIFASAMDGVSLAEIMDTVVRGKVHASLCTAMGSRTLDDVFAQKKEIINEVEADVKAMFAPMGITIGFVGFADALDYDKVIQTAINHVYTAKKDAEAANSLASALPVMQQEADIEVKKGIADGIRTKGIPTLPSFVVLPQAWIDAAASFFNTAGPAKK
jgi:regulator of protease activity HflC (stomatin/prohibitin superfamily)